MRIASPLAPSPLAPLLVGLRILKRCVEYRKLDVYWTL